MTIRDAIHAQGERLFRVRGYLPLLLLPGAFFALRGSEHLELRYGDFADDLLDGFCVAVSTAGLALRVAIVGFVPGRSSGRNTGKGQVASELNATGLYSIVRHPLYLANGLILAGLLLATGSLWFTLLGLLACALLYERLACAEEEFLSRRFGARFRAWAERTPAFLPRPSLWVRPALPFCARTALRREYTTAFGLVAGFAALDYLEDAIGAGPLELEPETTLALAALGFATVRYLHKRTRILHVAGR